MVHIHGAYGPSFVRKLILFTVGKCLGCRIIFQIHAGHFERYFESCRPWTRLLLRYVLRSADAVVALSESLKEEIDAVLNSRRKIHVVGNPIDTRKYRPAAQRTSAPSTLKLLFLGAIIKPKGVYDLIESAKRLVREGFQISLTLAGDREIARAKRQSEQAGLGGVVQFPGWLAEPQKLEVLRDSDVLLLPSYTEGLPLSVLEAMACGLPVVCTAVGGLRDLVVNGENGFVIDPGDVDALTECTARLLRNNALRRQIGRNNVGKIKNDYSLNVIAKKIGRLYDEVLGITRSDDQ